MHNLMDGEEICNMLNVIKYEKTVKEVFEIDPYVPLKIRWGEWNIIEEHTLYWRTGSLKKSLLEIGIASRTGLIRSVTIIHCDKIFFDREVIGSTVPEETGTPVFDIRRANSRDVVDDPGIFEIIYETNKLSLTLSKNRITKNLISGRVRFGLDSGSNVCMIHIAVFNESESEKLKDALLFLKKQNN